MLAIVLALSAAVILGNGSLFTGSLYVDKTRLVAQTESAKSHIETDLAEKKVKEIECPVAVVGGGSGGVAAAMQSARLGVETCIFEETDWLGGMLSSAGVAAIDGHEETSTGMFLEIKKQIIDYYKSKGKLDETHQCKVSSFCFEPSVGNEVIQKMVKATPHLKVFLNAKVDKIYKENKLIKGLQFTDASGKSTIVNSKVMIDATEYGDVMYIASVPYDLGYEQDSTEALNKVADECIQPLTYVAILKKFVTPQTPVKPEKYNPENYRCLTQKDERLHASSDFDANYVQNYGKLPNNKLLINIPSHSCGNDFHATAAELDSLDRQPVLEMAKDYSRGFIYFLQTELGLDNYGIYNEFNTADGFAKIPYMRESRRLVGEYRLTQPDVMVNAETGRSKFFSSSIAIGDYPIDLHFCSTGIGDVFYEVKPYQIPYEVTVPKDYDGLLVAEKNISVSHIVNGTTRLQPVVMSVGQAVGAAAALSVQGNVQPRDLDVRKLQDTLIQAKSMVYFFSDVPLSHYAYVDITEMAMDGLIRGYNDLTFRPVDTVKNSHFIGVLGNMKLSNLVYPSDFESNPDNNLTYQNFYEILVKNVIPGLGKGQAYTGDNTYASYAATLAKLKIVSVNHKPDSVVTRADLAVIVNRIRKS